VEKVDERTKYKALILRRMLFSIICILLIYLLIGISLSIGSIQVPLVEVYSVILSKIFPYYFSVDSLSEVVIWHLRFPRTIMAVLCGMTLAIAGSKTMAILRNPLATPYTLGISASAGFGAALAIVFSRGLLFEGTFLIIGNAFLLSLIPITIIILYSKKPSANPESIILMGVAINYIFSACNTLLQFFAESDAVKAVVFWLVGDLARASWWQIPYVFSVLLLLILISIRMAPDISIMKMGDDQAKALGVNVEMVRKISLIMACLSTSTVISFTGAIGFVGLLSTHICRYIIGEDERYLIPISGLFGANLLLFSDIIARRVIAPAILPVGAITAIMGGPLLIILLLRRK